MCLSELQAGLNEGQPLFPTHALCIRRSQQHRSPSAGIDFRGAFRILNISELHQRNWYLAQYIPAGKNREHLFSWLSEQHVLPWTPLILKKVRRTDKVCGYRRHIHAVFPGYFFLKADPERHAFTHLRRHSAFLGFVKMAGEIKTVREDIVQSLMKVYPDPALNPAAREELDAASTLWLTKARYQYLLRLDAQPLPESRIALLLHLVSDDGALT
ncbi:TPA: transcription termination factor NusG [Escherichia coli]|nr:transcription termination/antitermination NusG family protein [Escherichia coli]EHB4371258.1 transcription termination factor NusG [Escherichia coli]EID8762723.1 transcription termination factor NusG [Escherichia coli]EIY9046717.1 transcription termination factor NusG [Escherichia coli]EJB8795184.1 transcription termination factor NusG [Escherichia coli]EJG6332064.1 transcription termination factor NusG [Escherichia coli]